MIGEKYEHISREKQQITYISNKIMNALLTKNDEGQKTADWPSVTGKKKLSTRNYTHYLSEGGRNKDILRKTKPVFWLAGLSYKKG